MDLVPLQEAVPALVNDDGRDVDEKVFFPNGYGVSIIRHSFSYGNQSGLFEVAVIEGDAMGWDIAYETPITSDVLGWLSPCEVLAVMKQVYDLPASKELTKL